MNITEYHIKQILDELGRAEKKFPLWPIDCVEAAAIVSEEAGELVKAANEAKWQNGLREQMSVEATHTAAMALRFLIHGPEYTTIPGKQINIKPWETDHE
jgi:hypothetical protein